MIQEGDHLIIRKDENLKCVQLRKNRKVFMEKMKFTMENVIGMPYGTTFELKQGTLVKVAKESKAESQTSKEDESNSGQQEADNRNLQDLSENQKLGRDDIEALKSEGVGGEAIIGQLIEHSATFKEKTEYSKEKYIRKKKKKHLPFYTILRPTTRLIAQMYYNRGPNKICYLRIDTLAQMLTQANVRSGSKVLLFENCSGLVLGALMERLGGQGEIVQIFNGEQANRTALESYNFPKTFYKTLRAFPLDKVNSLRKCSIVEDTDMTLDSPEEDNADSDEDEIKTKQCKIEDSQIAEESESNKSNDNNESKTEKISDSSLEISKETSSKLGDSVIESLEAKISEGDLNIVKIEQEKEKSMDVGLKEGISESDINKEPEEEKNKATDEGNEKQETFKDETNQGTKRKLTKREKNKQRREKHYQRSGRIIERGDMDCLIVACKFQPAPVVMKLLEFVSPSRPFAIYCQFKEPLVDCYLQIKQAKKAVQVNLTETWLRQYQVLPERTHPLVNMSGTGGYLLTGITVQS